MPWKSFCILHSSNARCGIICSYGCQLVAAKSSIIKIEIVINQSRVAMQLYSFCSAGTYCSKFTGREDSWLLSSILRCEEGLHKSVFAVCNNWITVSSTHSV